MAYSFEGISTHPERRIKVAPCYEDIYRAPSGRKVNESMAFMDLDSIKAREPLKVILPDKNESSNK